MKKNQMQEAVIVAMGRSPIGKAPKGSLRYLRPEDLGAQVLQGMLSKLPSFDLSLIQDFVLGCAFPEAEQGVNLARMIGLKADLPVSVPAQTINRFCSSGLQSIATAAFQIQAGQADCILAGGLESMSAVPMGGNLYYPDPDLIQHHPDAYISMGITAENVAEQYHISREAQDAFAQSSHEKAAQAIRSGKFKDDIVTIQSVRPETGKNVASNIEQFVFSTDEGVRYDSSLEALSKLRPVFKQGGTVTAGNSSQTSDGAAFVLMMSKEMANEMGYTPIATFRSFAVTGVEPRVMGIGPIYAIPKALDLARLSISDIGLIELNEAFASQSIACIRELGLNEEIVNVNGGAIALGHPLGCTGTFLTIKLLSEMRRREGIRYGLVSMCIGGGMGAACIFESGQS